MLGSFLNGGNGLLVCYLRDLDVRYRVVRFIWGVRGLGGRWLGYGDG